MNFKREKNEMSQPPESRPSPPKSLILTKWERNLLGGFRRQYKRRFVNYALVSFVLIYCLLAGTASVYYACKMFAGAKDVPTLSDVPETGGDSTQRTEKLLAPVLERLESLDFLGIGWTNALHAGLLFYISTRCFRRLWRLWHHTPRAKLVIKLASRLEELGEL